MRSCRAYWLTGMSFACGIFWASGAGPLLAQPVGAIAASQFELAETVQVDQVDHAVLAQWERAKALLADRQWDEALEILGQLAESPEGKLLAVTNRRYVSLRAWCQLQLAALPPEALKLYRKRVDPVAQKWYQQGLTERDRRLLQKIVDQAFASRYGDKALMALGEMALEAGDFSAARWYWERIVPNASPAGTSQTWPGYPDTDLDLATVRARLVLVSILGGAEKMGISPISRNGSPAAGQKWDLSPFSARARQELVEFVRLHPDAKGRLGGREGKYADLLRTLLAESVAWPTAASDPNWVTFAGNVERNRIASRLADVGAVSWRIPLRPTAAASDRLFEPRTASENPREPLSFHPCRSATWCWSTTVGEYWLSVWIMASRFGAGRRSTKARSPAWCRRRCHLTCSARPVLP